ncbi:MAG: erythromycin esterase family protein, partial [Lachnospiraceae bacterium]|nr:erythromycin esterase family protein [Lachnospiraceae bacterium]
MTTFKKVWAGMAALIIAFFAVLLVLRSGILFGAEKKIGGIEEAGVSFDEFKIPENVRVVGIGEATHGNREFQTLKKLVLQKLVNEGDGRAIAFEISAGEAEMLNDAIHNEDSDIIGLLGKQSYPLYDTEEIADLLNWMREYNKNVSYEEALMFYGVDMQGGYTSVEYMQSLCESDPDIFTQEEKAKLLSIDTDNRETYSADKDFFVEMGKRLNTADDVYSSQVAALADVIVQYIEAPDFETDPAEYSSYRDRCMAENLKCFSELEESRGYTQILITAHNGHVMKGSSAAYDDENLLTMGENINRLFEGSYFCIGSEFYNTCVNIHTAGTYDEEYERADHEYCSDDPLAYQAKFFDDGWYCLDFTKLNDADSAVYKTVHSLVFTGLVGEGYNVLSDISKSYRMKIVPADRYDAVVYYYEANPI